MLELLIFGVFHLTSLFNRQSIPGHRDLLFRGSDPVQHASPALHREGEVGACRCRALVDAQHCDKETGVFVSEKHSEVINLLRYCMNVVMEGQFTVYLTTVLTSL